MHGLVLGLTVSAWTSLRIDERVGRGAKDGRFSFYRALEVF